MKIASWNVNSVRARLETVTNWFKQASPDIACLQEIKCVDEQFPAEPFEAMGYNVATHGQKSYNGVAVLSKLPFEEILPRLPGDEDDEQARYLEAVVSAPSGPVRVASIYLPNGNPVATEKFTYKLGWMDRLRAHAELLLTYEEPLVLAGDYNVIPTDDDVHDPDAWRGDALFQPEVLARFNGLLNLGFIDALRAGRSEAGLYTFWDYQRGAWPKNHGIRIDHLLLSPEATDRLLTCEIDKDPRAWDKPSDHTPIWVELDL